VAPHDVEGGTTTTVEGGTTTTTISGTTICGDANQSGSVTAATHC
jgi:hypothetical protein